MRHGRGHTLTNREAEERCVRRDWTSGCRVGDARDSVDYQVAVSVDGYLQTPLGSGLDELVDGFLDLLLKVVHDRVPSQHRLSDGKRRSGFLGSD